MREWLRGYISLSTTPSCYISCISLATALLVFIDEHGLGNELLSQKSKTLLLFAIYFTLEGLLC